MQALVHGGFFLHPTRQTMLHALIFDVDGTLADTESAHRAAFNEAFSAVGKEWLWDEPTYTRLLEISGGKERILHYWKQVQPDLRELSGSGVRDTVERIHLFKTAAYERIVGEGGVTLRPGVLQLMDSALRSGMRLAIATTTSPVNIGALLRQAIGPDWSCYFQWIEDATSAPLKKPHPQVYLQTLRHIELPAHQCLALEDSANGLQSARAAGLQTVITPTGFTQHHEFAGALRVLPDLSGVTLAHLQEWHAAATHLLAVH